MDQRIWFAQLWFQRAQIGVKPTKKVKESKSVFHPVPVEGWKQQFTEYMSETDDQYLKDEVPQSRKDDVHKAFVSNPCNILVKSGCFCVPLFKGHELHRNCWGRDWNYWSQQSLPSDVSSFLLRLFTVPSFTLSPSICLSTPTWGSWDGRPYDTFGWGLGTKPRHLKHTKQETQTLLWHCARCECTAIEMFRNFINGSYIFCKLYSFFLKQ